MKPWLLKRFSSLLIFAFMAGCASAMQMPPSTPVPTNTPTPLPVPTNTPAPLPPSIPYWPIQDWRTSTPEQQGMDSEKLAQMLESIKAQFHSLLIIRHGYIVTEAYFYPFRQNDPHVLVCASKSFLSALTGIALDQGYIENIDQRLLDFFPQRIPADNDPRKASITLRHLLTNTSGLGSSDSAYFTMMQKKDWLQFALDLPMSTEPGAQFNYFTIDSYLLSAVLQEKIGGMESFARKNLLEPLGISNAYWGTDTDGRLIPADLQMSTRDMAKFGYLYLHQGVWDGRQVVPADWVAASTQAQPNARYGYLWWVQPNGYAAEGGEGQCIFVIPGQDMLVVSTGGLNGMCQQTDSLIKSYIIPAITSPEPLPENPQAAARLKSTSEQLGLPPVPQPIPPLPATASDLSGKTFLLEKNKLGWETLALEFQKSEAQLTLSIKGQPQKLAIGLDDVYRITDADLGTTALYAGKTGRGPIALKGVWRDETHFFATMQFLNGIASMDLQFLLVGQNKIVMTGGPDYISGTLQK
jgi:CubicO group peptidase (beta-lactamase class C family)